MDLVRQSNDGWARESAGAGFIVPATVDDDFGFAADEKDDGAMRLAYVQRLIVLIENENGLPHLFPGCYLPPCGLVRPICHNIFCRTNA